MKILVTGGAGFIGSHVTDALLAHNHEVHVLDNLSSGRRANLPDDVPLHVHDIRAEESKTLFARHNYQVLIHHAAQMDVRASVNNPGTDAEINIGGFLNLMEAGRQHDLEKVVFASTGGAIYGEPEYTPQDEHHPLKPLSPYGIAKLTTEKYLSFYQQQYGIQSICLRYANVYGPRQSPQGEAGVVAIFSSQMLKGHSPTINGSGTQTRDYVYVGDVVRANVAALNHESSGAFNVGTACETSVNDLFHMIRAEANADCEKVHGPAKPGEQQRSVLDYSKAAELLDWTPEVDIRDGLSRTVDWFRSQRMGEAPDASPPVGVS
jgi:UDP-glucose 4-epimerase